LKEHEYANSPAVVDWAKPYVEEKWKFTAMKVAKKDAAAGDEPAAPPAKDLSASAIRISFTTDEPLFPYREPASAEAAKELNAPSRTLRIFFLSDARFDGKFKDSPNAPWSGKVVWADELRNEQLAAILEQLKVPETAGPALQWLTEFSDDWKYEA